MANHKLCPLAAAYPQQEDASCLGEDCACYVKMHKPRYMKADHYRIIDPEYFYRYVGCGLVTHIPWELVKRKQKPKANSEEATQ